ncbi:hypothetical protein C922_05163 [Plasmodium inui San Antonio 1]|uniref:Uncharacterized protein n=1 Tax=Plasmodium inui San Antonio 1 TaxID=1237626 RepID=W7A5T2_9APIC|nr:hypothetical protein C922_05163 [Plasmodium inui San Antonio 1]EUD64449.1 hypothetical protein C922_05163 [Plasmodium inui San Antonio 1]
MKRLRKKRGKKIQRQKEQANRSTQRNPTNTSRLRTMKTPKERRIPGARTKIRHSKCTPVKKGESHGTEEETEDTRNSGSYKRDRSERNLAAPEPPSYKMSNGRQSASSGPNVSRKQRQDKMNEDRTDTQRMGKRVSRRITMEGTIQQAARTGQGSLSGPDRGEGQNRRKEENKNVRTNENLEKTRRDETSPHRLSFPTRQSTEEA